MSQVQTLFITTVYNLKIKEDLGEGIELWDKIQLTNSKQVIRSLITDDLKVSAGALETTALVNADAVFYAIDYHDINGQTDDVILCDYIASCKSYLHDLWLAKDHCGYMMIGYIEYPYANPTSTIIVHNAAGALVHSNSITSGHSMANGVNDKTTLFTKLEIQRRNKQRKEDNVVHIPFSETSVKTSLLEKGMARITLVTLLTQTARSTGDLGLKISHYCAALEGLFTNDNTELAHKVSERVAFFLISNPKKRLDIFKQVKDIYHIRSQVVHGGPISKKYGELVTISKNADAILRKTFNKIQRSRKLDRYYRKNDNDGLEKHMTNLIMGIKN